MRKYFVSLSMFLLITITSCSLNQSVIINDASCEAPCWRNIHVGETTKEEAQALLMEMKDIQKNSIQHTQGRDFVQEGLVWKFSNRNEQYGNIFFHNNKVVQIVFTSESGESLSKLIKYYGDPSEVWILKRILDGVMLTINFIYPDRGICFEYQPSIFFTNPDKYTIKPSINIKQIVYFDPALSPGQINFTCDYSIDDKMIQSWSGFGEYQVFQK